MNTKTTAIITAATLALGAALPVFAIDVGLGASAGANVRTGSTTVGAKTSAALTARIEKGKARAKEEIARRVAALGELGSKVNAMARVSADMKTSIAATVQSQIAALSSLQAKIEADTDIDTLKADIKSIGESYRIFMLILPQGRITTAADSIHITAGTLSTLAGKLDTRIKDAQAKGKDVTAAATLLADMNAKIADAKVQADAAVSLTTSLKPDNGDKAIMDANKKALKDAQAKLKAAREDLKAARKAAGDIVKSLKEMKTDATVAATTTTTTTVQ
ncbi:hypothetical protein HYT05_00145 [Candidatus Kaiserbacteria bacterium]|nr:hypothetical protein [Candidatus Kaiserbacteria bacterium]